VEESRREIKQRNHGQNLSSLMKVMKENIQESHPTLKRWTQRDTLPPNCQKGKMKSAFPAARKLTHHRQRTLNRITHQKHRRP
jgi:hypothetical protein